MIDPQTKQLLEDINTSIQGVKDENGKAMAAMKEANDNTGKQATEALARANEAAEKTAAHAQAIIDLEQRIAANVNKGTAAPQTLGQIVIQSEEFKQFAAGASRKMTVQANTITGQEGSPPENSNTIVAPDRLNGIIPGAFRTLRIRDFLPQGNTSSNMVEYVRELVFQNNAAETAEAAQKPESSLTFELANAPVRTIATFIKASKQVLEDAPALASYIDTRLRYAVEYRLDSQLVNGDGVGQNISGILDTGNFTPFTPATGENALDTVNRMMYAVWGADYAPTAILMNPATWGGIERTKVGPTDNTYIIGQPGNAIGPRLWGLPVVLSNAVPLGKIIVGAFDIAFMFFNRQNAIVEMFEQDTDNVQKNLITIRSELRGALASFRPASVVAGNATL